MTAGLSILNLTIGLTGLMLCLLGLLLVLVGARTDRRTTRYLCLIYITLFLFDGANLAGQLMRGHPGSGIRAALYISNFVEFLSPVVIAYLAQGQGSHAAYRRQEEPGHERGALCCGGCCHEICGQNINKAKSEVGRERMAISLAFLKQTMLPERFRAYCANLNAQRGIPQNDVTNERYIDPRTIGTVNEVYEETRERVRKVTEREDGAKPDPRDLAMLTALSRLGQRGGGDKAVEQRALQEEIAKVQSSPQFQRAMQRDSADELIRKAFYGSLKSLDGYEKPAPSGPVAEDPAQARL
jgi:hypothetical protein